MSYVNTLRGLGAAPVEPVAHVDLDLLSQLSIIAATLSIAVSLLYLGGRK